MSERANRHRRRPSQGVFVLPDNLSDPLTDDIAPAPPAAQAPHPPQERSAGGAGVQLPPQPPQPKRAEEKPNPDRSGK
ncbi:hypothetical protein ABFS83_12G134000 [Erythranthe nasuta]